MLWNRVSGTVIRSEYHQEHVRKSYVYKATVFYQYILQNVRYTASTYSFTDRDTWFYDEVQAKKFVDQYKVGMNVVVYVDPASKASVLYPGVHGANNGLVMMILGCIAIAFSPLLLFPYRYI